MDVYFITFSFIRQCEMSMLLNRGNVDTFNSSAYEYKHWKTKLLVKIGSFFFSHMIAICHTMYKHRLYSYDSCLYLLVSYNESLKRAWVLISNFCRIRITERVKICWSWYGRDILSFIICRLRSFVRLPFPGCQVFERK